MLCQSQKERFQRVTTLQMKGKPIRMLVGPTTRTVLLMALLHSDKIEQARAFIPAFRWVVNEPTNAEPALHRRALQIIKVALPPFINAGHARDEGHFALCKPPPVISLHLCPHFHNTLNPSSHQHNHSQTLSLAVRARK